MEIYFNELSIKNKSSVDYNAVQMIASAYKELSGSGITTCRIAAEDCHRLFQMIQALPESVNVRNFYFSFFRPPYESDAVEDMQDTYFSHSWQCGKEECVGLAFAFLLDSAGVSICGPDWNVPFVDILKDERRETVRNICSQEHVKLHFPRKQETVSLIKTNLAVREKAIVLRDDHGADVLEKFSRRLIQSPYVTGVINSLPYNPNKRRFIKRIREDGLIEIVLPWTDEGLGIVVKTTGRTMQETEAIAKILEEEYSCT